PGRLFAPQSDVQSALLAAADRRLAPILRTAIGNQAVSPPAPTTAVLALRIIATPIPPPDEITVNEPRQLLVDGVADAITPGSWLLVEQRDATTGVVTRRP